MVTSPASFSLFTSLRHDPALRSSSENSSDIVSFSPSSSFYMLRYHRDRMLEAAQHFEWTAVANKLANGTHLESLLGQQVEAWRTQNTNPESPLKVRVLFNQQGSMHTDIAPTPTLPLSTLYPSTFPAPSTEPPKPFTPSPKTGGALTLGPSDATVTKPTPWILTLDTSPTPPSPHTLLKTTHRAHYDAARARSQPATPPPGPNQLHEVLLWNTVDEMTEGSFTSVYFFRGGRWVTPPVGVPQRQEEEDGSAVVDEGELREPFAGRWGHSVRSAKAVAGSGGQRGTTRRWALKKGLCMEEPVGRGTVRVGEEVWVSNGVRGFGRGRVVEARGTVG